MTIQIPTPFETEKFAEIFKNLELAYLNDVNQLAALTDQFNKASDASKSAFGKIFNGKRRVTDTVISELAEMKENSDSSMANDLRQTYWGLLIKALSDMLCLHSVSILSNMTFNTEKSPSFTMQALNKIIVEHNLKTAEETAHVLHEIISAHVDMESSDFDLVNISSNKWDIDVIDTLNSYIYQAMALSLSQNKSANMKQSKVSIREYLKIAKENLRSFTTDALIVTFSEDGTTLVQIPNIEVTGYFCY